MLRRFLFTALVPLALASAGGCATRIAAATQNSTLVFDAAKSDPKAIAVADQVLAAVGGAENWAKAKEVIWSQGIVEDGKLIGARMHAWDRWNGRHQYTRFDMNGGVGVVMHELFDTTAHAFAVTPEGEKTDVMRSDKAKMVEEANKVFYPDQYLLMLQFKLRDPGVHLALDEERPEEGAPITSEKKYDVLKITFDKGVGPASDTYYLVISKATHLPTVIERHTDGQPENVRSGFKLDNWTESGGLKFAMLRTTLGITKPDAPKVGLTIPKAWEEMVPMTSDIKVQSPGEVVIIGNVVVHAEPDDNLYVPKVM